MTPALRSRILLYWTAVGTFLTIAATLMTPVILVGALLAPLLVCDRALLKAEILKFQPITTILLLTGLYLLINASWSLDVKNAYISVATIFVVALVSHVGVSALSATQPEHLQIMRRGVVFGIALGAAFLCFEYMTRFSLQRGLQAIFAALNISPIRIQTGPAEAPFWHIFNRNLINLVMLVWVACLIQIRLDPSKRGRIIVGALFAGVTIATLLSSSASAKIGLLGGAAVFAIQYFVPRIGFPLVTAAWVGICAFVLPLTHYLYRAELYNASWLFASARHRILIWGATSDWYWKTPWLGAGVSTARGLDPLDPAHRVNSPGLETAALNWHSHNVYLQVWFETGAVGALLLLSIGLLLLRAVWRSGPSDRPALLAAFASSGLMASTAFSIWAAWYLAAFGLVALFAVLAVTHGAPARGVAAPAQ